MGAGQSAEVEIGGSSMGYQVLRVYPDSPGSEAGLKAYFDFIVAIGNTRFNKEDGSLREILKASVDQKIRMIVYNTSSKNVREVDIVPTTSWGGSGLLGVSIKHSSFDKADERVWHVTEVEPNSPAQQAGLKAMNDYVIGSDSILQESDDLYTLIETHEGKALKLFVYNLETDNCREIVCHPNSRWGGRGYLGCEFGHGLLHRIPFSGSTASGGSKKPSLPPNAQQSVVMNSQQNNVPANSQQANLLQHQAAILNRTTTQPGQQLFQQTLFNDQSALDQQQQQQDAPKPPEKPTLPQPPQAPQTFAQLASAQFQAQQYQQQTAQIQQQQQLLEQQRQQLEHQQRQMELLSANQQQQMAAPSASDSAPMPPMGQSYSSEPQQPYSHQRDPHLPPPLQHQHLHQQPPKYLPPNEQSLPRQMSPQPSAPPAQSSCQPPQQPAQFQSAQQQQQLVATNQVQQVGSYQQYAYSAGSQFHVPNHQMAGPFSEPSGDSDEPNLPPSIQTLPPPPPMYPPPPQAPSQQQQQQLPAQSPTQQSPAMFTNQM